LNQIVNLSTRTTASNYINAARPSATDINDARIVIQSELDQPDAFPYWTYDVGSPQTASGGNNGLIRIIGGGTLARTQVLAAMDSAGFLLTRIIVAGDFLFVADNAFSQLSWVTSIVFESGSVTTLGMSTFFTCNKLENLTLPSGLTQIPAAMCQGCIKLPSIVLPPLVTSIGDNAFHDCFALSTITIPSGVTSMGNSVFRDTGMEDLTFPSGLTSIGDNVLLEAISVTKLRMRREIWETIAASLPTNSRGLAQNVTFYNDDQSYEITRTSSGVAQLKSRGDTNVENIKLDIDAASNMAVNLLNAAKTQSDMTLLADAEKIIEDAKNVARLLILDQNMNDATTRAYIDMARPSDIDFNEARFMIETMILDRITTNLTLASSTAQNLLVQVMDGSHQYLVDRARKIIDDAKSLAMIQRDQIVTLSFQTNADTLILDMRPSSQDIVAAQQIVTVANTNSSDEDLIETVRKILTTMNDTVQETLDQGGEDKELLESLQKLVMEAINNAASLLTSVNNISDAEKEELLKETYNKTEILSDVIQMRLDRIVVNSSPWIEKNLVAVIVVSIVLVLLLSAVFVYIRK
jgi:hypothetical protein